MGWDESAVPDPQDPQTFLRSKLHWEEAADGIHARMLSLYRELIALRRAVPDLSDPAFSSLAASADESERWFRLTRGGVEILVNFAADERDLPVSSGDTLMLSTSPATALIGDVVHLGPRSAAVVARSLAHQSS